MSDRKIRKPKLYTAVRKKRYTFKIKLRGDAEFEEMEIIAESFAAAMQKLPERCFYSELIAEANID